MHDQTLLVHGDNSHLRIRHTFASSNAFLGRIHIEANGLKGNAHIGTPLAKIFVRRTPFPAFSWFRVCKGWTLNYQGSIHILSRELISALNRARTSQTCCSPKAACVRFVAEFFLIVKDKNLPCSNLSLDKIIPIIIPNYGMAIGGSVEDACSLVLCCFQF